MLLITAVPEIPATAVTARGTRHIPSLPFRPIMHSILQPLPPPPPPSAGAARAAAHSDLLLSPTFIGKQVYSAARHHFYGLRPGSASASVSRVRRVTCASGEGCASLMAVIEPLEARLHEVGKVFITAACGLWP